jgi:hypothetical protein
VFGIAPALLYPLQAEKLYILSTVMPVDVGQSANGALKHNLPQIGMPRHGDILALRLRTGRNSSALKMGGWPTDSVGHP